MAEKNTRHQEIARQGSFGFTRWGGKRKRAGRKPNGAKAGVSHDARPLLSRHHPVHVTLRLKRGLPSLRRSVSYRALKRAFSAGCERFGFRLLHYSIQSNQCVQKRLTCSAGDKPAGAIAKRPVAWMASTSESECSKPIDEAFHGKVSEFSGRNYSERTSSLEIGRTPGGRDR